jgi:hypothetical protein
MENKKEKQEVVTLSDFLEKIKSLQKDIGYEYFYRGHNEKIETNKITPPVYRKVSEDSNSSRYISYEEEMFYEVIRKKPHDFSEEKTILEKLVKMSHSFLPTRLLDITSNPLVALYFACLRSSKFSKDDGEVVIFKIPKREIKKYDGDTASLISNLVLMPPDFPKGEKNHGYLVYEIIKERPTFELNEGGEIDLSKVFAIKVKLSNERIIQQSGAFLIFGMENIKELPARIPSEWTVDFPPICIRNNNKNDLLEELELININESTLFPDLDRVTNHIIDTIARRERTPKIISFDPYRLEKEVNDLFGYKDNLSEKQQNILKWMFGKWVVGFVENGIKTEIELNIGHISDPSQVIRFEDGKEVLNKKFDTPHDFFGDYLMEGPFVIDVNRSSQNNLIFGISNNHPNIADADFKEFKREPIANFEINLNEIKPEAHFTFTRPNSSIFITRIIINSLLGQGPGWAQKLNRLSPFLEISFSKGDRFLPDREISLDAYITSYHHEPVIDFNKEFPNKDNWSADDIHNFLSCRIKLSYKPQNDVKPDITIFCETSRGVQLL